MTTPSPIVILVHGAFHGPIVFDGVRARLESLGYTVETPMLATVSEDRAFKTWRDDAAVVNVAAQAYFDEGRECVLVAHSYGCIPATAAACTESIPQRAKKGLAGGWSKVVLVGAAVQLQRRASLLDGMGGVMPDWMVGLEGGVVGNTLHTDPGNARHRLYNDLPEDQAEKWVGLLRLMSQDAYEMPIEHLVSDIGVPVTFLIPQEDNGMPPEYQEMVAATVPESLRSIERCPCGHSPFLSQLDRFVEVIEKVAQGYIGSMGTSRKHVGA